MNNVRVSVICVTYNHEKYIAKALDSILMQETTFDYEVLVGDDCSTDNTANILRDYASRYPDIIRPYCREKNIGATANEYELFMDARGDYIAALELDDVWLTKDKLQKQYDFLESHSEYIGVAHDFAIINSVGEEIDNDDNVRIKSYFNRSFTLSDFLEDGFVFQTGTHFYRNIFKDGRDYSVIYKADRLIRDKTVLSLLLDRGDFYILPFKMSAYRRFFDDDATNGRFITNANLELDLFTKAHHIEVLNKYFEGRIDYSKQWSDIIFDYMKRAIKRREGYRMGRCIHMLIHADNRTRKEVLNLIKESIACHLI